MCQCNLHILGCLPLISLHPAGWEITLLRMLLPQRSCLLIAQVSLRPDGREMAALHQPLTSPS